jgi:hypothetical protein
LSVNGRIALKIDLAKLACEGKDWIPGSVWVQWQDIVNTAVVLSQLIDYQLLKDSIPWS